MRLDVLVDDELHARQADAVDGQEARLERDLRIAEVDHHMGRRAAPVATGRWSRSGTAPCRHRPCRCRPRRSSPSPPCRWRASPSRPLRRPRPEMPSSRLTIAAWQVRPPRLVTIAAAVFITGSQSRRGGIGHQHLARLEVRKVVGVLDHADGPLRDLRADGAAGGEHRAGALDVGSPPGCCPASATPPLSGRAWTM